MGLDINGTRFLFYAKTMGVDFSHTAMIGRQHLNLQRNELRAAFEAFRHSASEEFLENIFVKTDGYAEPFLNYLGAKDGHSFDNSAYEGATHLHDMNEPLAKEFSEQYSTVLDGGSLEHVFNFPVAIKNCMEMVKVGGHFLAITPANNFMGHGFYQFSPELFYSVFTNENGFELINMIAFEDKPNTRWYTVKSPRQVKARVSLINNFPFYLLIIAKRTAKSRIFATTPQQSDYLSIWHPDDSAIDYAPSNEPAADQFSTTQSLKNNVAGLLKSLLKPVVGRINDELDPHFFQPMDPTEKDS